MGLVAAYELLRAFALGEPPAAHPPAGFGVLLRSGLPAWLALWRDTPPPPNDAAVSVLDRPTTVATLRSELVLVLATMALGQQPAVRS